MTPPSGDDATPITSGTSLTRVGLMEGKIQRATKILQCAYYRLKVKYFPYRHSHFLSVTVGNIIMVSIFIANNKPTLICLLNLAQNESCMYIKISHSLHKANHRLTVT